MLTRVFANVAVNTDSVDAIIPHPPVDSRMIQYPKPNAEELPGLYDELDELLGDAETALRTHFIIETDTCGNERVVFGEATTSDFLNALWEDSHTLMPLFQKVTGLPDREFERLYGEKNIGNLRDRKTDFRDEEKAVRFANALIGLLPNNLALETVLFTFVKMWESDQRRHKRGQYEEYVREHLAEHGYSNFKGNTLPGEPDFVIPTEEPYEIIGEVRVIQQRDQQKRFKEFGSEARAAAVNFSEAKFVAVASVTQFNIREQREKIREEVHKASAANIDAVVFQDELDRLIEQLNEWNITHDRLE